MCKLSLPALFLFSSFAMDNKLYLIAILLSSRFQLKTQFDKNVVTHFEAQEQVLDYIFSHLGIDNEGSVPHPIVMTEAFVTPNYSRQCKEVLKSLINFILS